MSLVRWAVFCVSCVIFLIPGEQSGTYGQSFSGSEYLFTEGDHSTALRFDNDTYYLTDYYYTYGLEFELTHPFCNGSLLSPLFPKVSKESGSVAGISVAQRLYTPKNIRDTTVQFNDRPFAATLTLDHFRYSFDERSGITFASRLRIGIIGPAAGGELLQQKIHDWIQSPEANGWKYQVNNDIILNYDFHLNYPIWLLPSYKLAVTTALRAGTLFDDMSIGVNLATGRNIFQQIHINNTPKSVKNKPKLLFNADAGLKFVMFNATLQGGVFSNSDPYVLIYREIEPFVFSAEATLGLLWNGILLSYTHHFLTKEFDKGSNHNYASIALSVYF